MTKEMSILVLPYILVICCCTGQTFAESSGYVGCFSIFSWDHLQVTNIDNNTADICKERCVTDQFRYAGTGGSSGFLCACLSDIASYAKSAFCSTRCPGNQDEICGDSSRFSMYDTLDAITTTTQKQTGSDDNDNQKPIAVYVMIPMVLVFFIIVAVMVLIIWRRRANMGKGIDHAKYTI